MIDLERAQAENVAGLIDCLRRLAASAHMFSLPCRLTISNQLRDCADACDSGIGEKIRTRLRHRVEALL
jgi:hypothetical protein